MEEESHVQTIGLPEGPKDYQYLVDCLLEMTTLDDLKQGGYSIDEIYNTKCLHQILADICPDYFSLYHTHEELGDNLVRYFYDMFGFYVQPLLRAEKARHKVVVLVLYACIYSGSKHRFVEKIMGFPLQVQEKLVSQFELLEMEMQQLRNWGEMIDLMKKLEAENCDLKDELLASKEQEEACQREITRLLEELEDTKKQKNKFVFEKLKILDKFELANLSEYEDLCMRLYYDNEALLVKQEEYQRTIKQQEEEIKLLRKGIRQTDDVIVELNFRNSCLIKNHEELAREIFNYQENTLGNRPSLKEKQSELTDSETSPSSSGITRRRRDRHSSIVEENLAELMLETKVTNLTENSTNRRRTSRNSAWNIFNATKDNLLMNEKLQRYEEQTEQLKLKIMELEVEVMKLDEKEKFYLKKNRKIEKLSDDFKSDYDSIGTKRSYKVL